MRKPCKQGKAKRKPESCIPSGVATVLMTIPNGAGAQVCTDRLRFTDEWWTQGGKLGSRRPEKGKGNKRIRKRSHHLVYYVRKQGKPRKAKKCVQ